MGYETIKNRRRFLRSMAGAISAGGAAALVPQLDIFGAALAASGSSSNQSSGPDDYKALVCLELNGGADSFNFLVPRDSAGTDSHYDNYRRARGGVYSAQNAVGRALDFDQLIPVSAAAGPGITTVGNYGLHPECRDHGSTPGLATLYDRGQLAFLANVGALTTPITKTEFENGTVAHPLGASGHANGLIYWKNGRDDPLYNRGWGGMIASTLNDPFAPSSVPLPPAISLSGNNLFQVGRYASNNQPLQPYSMNINGAPGFSSIISPNGSAAGRAHEKALEEMLALTYDRSLDSEVQRVLSGAVDLNVDVNRLLLQGRGSTDPADGWGRINTPYQTTGNFDPVNNLYPPAHVVVNGVSYPNLLLSKFRTIAQMIKLSRDPRAGINARRQVFFVSLPGFDTHFTQMEAAQPVTTAQFSQAIGYFSQALEELGVEEKVTTFSISEFGRTLTPNAGGTDHAWGGNHFIMGGAVNGGRVYGRYPELVLNANNNSAQDWSFQRGEYLPTTSIEQYGATLGNWMGMGSSELDTIFPNLRNFDRNLGFMV